MRDTPRTDAVQYREILEWVVDADYARKLERELAAMTEARDKALTALTAVERKLSEETRPSAESTFDAVELKALRELIAELEEVET